MPKISELTSVTSIVGDEEMPVVQSATTKKATVDNLLGYSVFSALVTYNTLSSEFDNNILKDSITGLSFTKTATGQIRIESAGGLFEENKTMVFVGQNNNNGGGGDGNFVYYTLNRDTTSIIYLQCFDVDVNNGTVAAADFFTKVPIEIRIYP